MCKIKIKLENPLLKLSASLPFATFDNRYFILFNVSGENNSLNLVFMAFVRSFRNHKKEIRILNKKNEYFWNNKFINYQKLEFPIQTQFEDFGCDYLVCLFVFFCCFCVIVCMFECVYICVCARVEDGGWWVGGGWVVLHTMQRKFAK